MLEDLEKGCTTDWLHAKCIHLWSNHLFQTGADIMSKPFSAWALAWVEQMWFMTFSQTGRNMGNEYDSVCAQPL